MKKRWDSENNPAHRFEWTEELQAELDKAQMFDPISEDLVKALVKMNGELLMFPDDGTMKPDDARRLVKRYLKY